MVRFKVRFTVRVGLGLGLLKVIVLGLWLVLKLGLWLGLRLG